MLKALAAVTFTKEVDPLAIPTTPSKGPFTNPSTGSPKNYCTPPATLENSETGFPIMSKFPTI